MLYCNWAATTPFPLVSGGSLGAIHVRTGDENQSFTGTREKIARFFHFHDPRRVIFGFGVTDLLNKLLWGSRKYFGACILTTPLEHNSVLRPLYYITKKGKPRRELVRLTPEGKIDLQDFSQKIRQDVGLVVVNHASNVTGILQPVEQVVQLAHEVGAKVILDCAQTAGRMDIACDSIGADAFVFSSHKALMGFSGLGFACLAEGFEPDPVFSGGTGAYSAKKEQPEQLPFRLESGTPNYLAIGALDETLDRLQQMDYLARNQRCNHLFTNFSTQVRSLSRFEVVGLPTSEHLPYLNLRSRDFSVEELGFVLSNIFEIQGRHGLHCAPLMHQHLGSWPLGTVRLSFGITQDEGDFEDVLSALQKMDGGYHAF